MTASEIALQFADAFHDVFLTFQRREPNRAAELTFESFGVLEHLARTGPLTVGEAAHHLSRSQSATSELVMRLERRGLLRRFPDTRDRRRHLVWLTEDGLAVLRDARQVLDGDRLAAALATLSERASRDLVRGLLRTAAAGRGGGEG
ncbi:MAG: MarR family winged helix-turn-helix transcriptional regulator [bacterium]|nr:MarR family winged helix-turn-helix transcriptional regulator [bacterium]